MNGVRGRRTGRVMNGKKSRVMNRKRVMKGRRRSNVGNRVPGETDLEHLILECLRGDAKMSAAKIAKRAKVTTRTIERVFVRLRTSGRILRKGGTRGSWEVRD